MEMQNKMQIALLADRSAELADRIAEQLTDHFHFAYQILFLTLIPLHTPEVLRAQEQSYSSYLYADSDS